MENSDYNIWQLFAGIGLFLFGMQLLENAIRHLAGRSFKIFLKNQTQNPVKAILAGLIVTAVLQSSSIVNLLVLAFVGARILTMQNALAVLLGSNLGSTVYNWIVVYLGFKFDIQSFAFPIMALAAIGLIFFQENKKIMHWTRLAFGMSLLFLGLANIKAGVETMVLQADLSVINSYGNLVFVLAGFVITAIVQSSSTLVVIALSALNAHAIGLEAAACLVIGSESGTAIKTLLVSIGTVADKKRVALGNLILNVVSSTVAFLMLGWLIYLITEVLEVHDPLIALVCFQSTINLSGIIIFYPILKPFGKWLGARFSDTNDKISFHLNKLLLNDPVEALKAIEKEGIRLIQNIIILNKKALEIDITSDYKQLSKQIPILHSNEKSYTEHYELVKHLNGELIDFCLDLRNRELNESEMEQTGSLIHMLRQTMNAAKSIKDIRHNIKEYRDSADDTFHGFYKRIKTNEEPFYSELSAMVSTEKKIDLKPIELLLSESKKMHDAIIQEAFARSSKNPLNEVEMATFMNVYEGIRLSHNSLVESLREICLLNGDSPDNSTEKSTIASKTNTN